MKRHNVHGTALILLLLCLAASPRRACGASDPSAAVDSPGLASETRTADRGETPRSRPPRTYFYVQGGVQQTDKESGGLRRRSSMSALSAGVGYRQGPIWSFELEMLMTSAPYAGPPVDAPILSVYDSERGYSLMAGTVWVRASRALGFAEPYVKGGLAICYPSMTVSGFELIFFPSVKTEGELTMAPCAAAGIQARMNRAFVGIEGRYLPLEQDFGELSPGPVSVGGPMILATVGTALKR